MNKKDIYKVLTVVSILITLVIALLKISPFTCCGCPPSGYALGSISWTLYLNNYLAPGMDCVDCRGVGCTLTSFVIPIETLLTTVLFGILWFKHSRKKGL